ncbi:hypothetical protein [Pseudotamlana carrageenivorans]|uniref:Uncharacterized protein n=1 Tax=Pseudotamlana carrageenivorans TaxID=2069432 RepID=A0A2I7SHJ3_9FLAO|nr:hypothetical protein [Tamlana carrageenivorans]AUS05350.1 hypothetical protein C1A40_07605 [Tamlana carrageenivorans]
MNTKPVFEKIDFVNKYESICKNHNDYENSMSGNNHELYSNLIKKLGYKAKYYKGETFYRIEEKIDDTTYGFQLTLKNGLVETMIDTKYDKNWCTPDGRLDFLCEDLDSNFDRDTYNLPKYTSEEELEIILKEIFSLYEDYKLALKEHLAKV